MESIVITLLSTREAFLASIINESMTIQGEGTVGRVEGVHAIQQSQSVHPSNTSIASSITPTSVLPGRTEEVVVSPNDDIIIIGGMGGIGKTIAAAIIASRVDVLMKFSDGVAWIHLGPRFAKEGEHIPYNVYKSHLVGICRQVGIARPRFDHLSSTDDEKKALGCMENAKQEMCNLLAGSNTLVVLDDGESCFAYFLLHLVLFRSIFSTLTLHLGLMARNYISLELERCQLVQLWKSP